MIGNILGVMQGMKTEGDSFRNIARGTETVLWGLKIILQIWRLGGHFCRAHGSSASPLLQQLTNKNARVSDLNMRIYQIVK